MILIVLSSCIRGCGGSRLDHGRKAGGTLGAMSADGGAGCCYGVKFEADRV